MTSPTTHAGKRATYPAYKPSGVVWLGDVPEHWDVKRAKGLLARNDGGVWGEDFDDDGVIVLRSTEQTVDGEWNIVEPARRRLTSTEYASCRLQAGDLVVTKSSGSSLHIGKTSIVTKEVEALNCCYSNFMQRVRVKRTAEPRFVWYVLNGELGRKQFDYYSSTTTGLANLNGTLIGNVGMAVPPLDEQKAIAAFLDRETARIDALIEKKRRQIELLQEKRSALISHAVTSGLDPNAPMKDSGYPGWQSVPAHWRVTQLRHLTQPGRAIMYGIVLPGPHVEDGVPIVKGGNCEPGRLRLDVISRTTHEIESRYERSRLRAGDIVYAIRGSIGEAEVVPPELDGANMTQDAARIAPLPDVNNRWLVFAVRSCAFFSHLDAHATGATIRGINIWGLKRAPICVPPLAEQRAIAAYLMRETTHHDELAAKLNKSICQLREFRSALIAEAVTGKIDVRGEVA